MEVFFYLAIFLFWVWIANIIWNKVRASTRKTGAKRDDFPDVISEETQYILKEEYKSPLKQLEWILAERAKEREAIAQKTNDEIELFKRYLVKRENIMTPTERAFYDQLRAYVDDTKCTIFSKVRLADIVNVKEQWRFDSKRVFNTIKSKHIDFVVADLDGRILKCIELDDPSHKEGNRGDWVKDVVCEIVGVDLTRVWVADKYDFEAI